MKKQPDFFNQEEKNTINSVADQLTFLDFSQQKNLVEQFRKIIKIFEEIRAKIIQITGKKTLSEVELEIDLKINPPEIKFKATNKPKNRLTRAWHGLTSKKHPTETLILSQRGYVVTDAERLERNHATHRLVQYSPSSSGNLREFFKKILKPE